MRTIGKYPRRLIETRRLLEDLRYPSDNTFQFVLENCTRYYAHSTLVYFLYFLYTVNTLRIR